MSGYFGDYDGGYDGNFWGQGSGVPANTVLGLTTAFTGAPGGVGLRWVPPESKFADTSDAVYDVIQHKVKQWKEASVPEDKEERVRKAKDDLKSTKLSKRIAILEKRVKTYKDKLRQVKRKYSMPIATPVSIANEQVVKQEAQALINNVIESHLADIPVLPQPKALEALPFALTALGMGLVTYYRFPRRPKVYRTLGYTAAIALAIKAATYII